MITTLLRRAAAAAALTLAVAPAARAQFVTVEARVGRAHAYGSAREQFGSAEIVGVGLSSQMSPTLNFRLDAETLTGFDPVGQGLRINNYTLGLESRIAPTRGYRAPVQVTATLMGGVSEMRRGAYGNSIVPATRYDARSEYNPLVGAGLRLSVDLSRTLAIVGSAQANATLLPDVAYPADGSAPPFQPKGGTMVFVPVSGGVRIRF